MIARRCTGAHQVRMLQAHYGTGTTSFQLISRGAGPTRTLNVPNWDALTDGVTIQWNDFE